MSKEKPLNNRTPKWFQDWHNDHFKPVKYRSVRNERWLYVIIVAIIGAAMVGNNNIDLVGRIVRAFGG